MFTISKKIKIKASPKDVFEFVVDPDNWTKFVTSLINVRDVKPKKARKGTKFKWTYRMMGVNFHGDGEITDLVENKSFAMKMEGKHPIAEQYTFTKVDGGTELSFEIEYDLPGKVMGVVAKTGLVDKMNKKEAENVLSKIKMFCEQ